MDDNERINLQEVVDLALAEMARDAGGDFDPSTANLAEFQRRTGLSRSKARTLKANGFRVTPHGRCGLSGGSCVLLEQIKTLDVSRLGEKVGSLTATQMHSIDVALAISLGLREVTNGMMLLSLCKSCWKTFYDSGSYLVIRADYEQYHREPCTLCGIRTGFDYKVVRK